MKKYTLSFHYSVRCGNEENAMFGAIVSGFDAIIAESGAIIGESVQL
jgi:hypothetical protein